MKDIFITGIDTDVGKSVVSAICVEALQYDYWKPIQCGSLEHTDTDQVKQWVTNSRTTFHKEYIQFKTPASPNIASYIENKEINLSSIHRPKSQRPIVIEGAGGVYVPLNTKQYIIDLMVKLDCHVIIVSKNYIGSINHTLLTVDALRKRGLHILGIVFNLEQNDYIENTIYQFTGLPKILHVHKENNMNVAKIQYYAKLLKKTDCANYVKNTK